MGASHVNADWGVADARGRRDGRGTLARPASPSDWVVVALAGGRVALGLVMLGGPGVLPRLFKVDPAASRAMEWAVRMVGGREVALGLGSVAAAGFEPASSRQTWLAASMLSDSVDSIALTTALAAGTIERRAGAVVAGSAALLALTEAALFITRQRNDVHGRS